MSKRHSLWVLAVLLLVLGAVWAQDNSGQPPAGATQESPQQPVPAYGQENPTPPVSENPPISGLDLPNLEPHAAPLSYLQLGAHLSEAVDSNVQNSLGGSSVSSVSVGLGSVDLRRLWSNYDLALDYVGGVGYYNAAGVGLRQIEEMAINQKITWKRGEFGVRDAFSYQPEGTFGASYGSLGAPGVAVGQQSAFFGGTALGALGQVPRIMNLALADVVESLTPKSSVTVTGGYGFVHFLENEPGVGNSFIGNSQVSGQVGYNRILGPHDQGALVYGYQGFQFSTGIDFHSHVIQVMWGHRISGRMDFLIGAGPQFTHVYIPPTSDLRITAAGRASLRYRFPKVSLDLTYEHYITSGSGFFSGADSDIARLSASRPLGRIWNVFSDLGFSRNSRLTSTGGCIPGLSIGACPGAVANRYEYGFAGMGLRRTFGRTLNAYASYQFNDLAFDSSFCGTTGPCSRISLRHIGAVGLDWTPRPTRLD